MLGDYVACFGGDVVNKPNDALFRYAEAVSIAAAPPAVRDEVMANFMERWKKSHPAKEDQERSIDDIEREMLDGFNSIEARAINGGAA